LRAEVDRAVEQDIAAWKGQTAPLLSGDPGGAAGKGDSD